MAELTKQCRLTGKDFIISEWEQDFLAKRGFPLPTLCIEERHRRRLAYRNERRMYKRKCDATGESIISIYSPDKNLTVYSPEFWWSDRWDARDYGRDYDFSRPFFEQFKELQRVVPRLSLLNTKAENSEYCNCTVSNRNCYLVFGGDFNEDCMYSIFCFYSRGCADLYWANRCELCYECVDCDDCYNCQFCAHAYNCKDSVLLYDCVGCSDCFGCVGLRNQQYHFFNEKYSKEEYANKIAKYNLKSFEGLQLAKEDFANFKAKFSHRHAYLINCENSSGNNMVNVKNCRNCFDVGGPAEDLKDVLIAGWNLHDALSCNHIGHGSDNAYEVSSAPGVSNCYFCNLPWYSNNLYYCDVATNNSHDLFGCCGMKKTEYCILNKQYKREEYEVMLPRIIEHMKSTGEWGEFFPIENSLFAYNETIANDYLPLKKEEALARGLKWQDEEINATGSGDAVPDSITDGDENIYKKTFVCEETGRPYRVNELEIKLYKKLGIPIPHFAPETRNVHRFSNRAPWKSWQRQCAKCSTDITTSFSPERPEKVYCEKCYLREVY